MPSKGSITKTIRLSAEDREYIESLINREECTWSGAIHKIIEGCQGVHPQKQSKPLEGTPLEMPEKDYKDLESMCRVSGMTIGQFMGYVYGLFNDGKIYIDGTRVKTRGECDLRELEEMCHRFNADPQDMIDKLVKSLTRG